VSAPCATYPGTIEELKTRIHEEIGAISQEKVYKETSKLFSQVNT
jgi:hypothetical protein